MLILKVQIERGQSENRESGGKDLPILAAWLINVLKHVLINCIIFDHPVLLSLFLQLNSRS